MALISLPSCMFGPFITFCKMFGRCLSPSPRPFLLTALLCCTRSLHLSLQCFFFQFGEEIVISWTHIEWVTAHIPTLPVASPTSQLIIQTFRRFTYVTVHSPTLPLLYLGHSSFSNPSRRFNYVTVHSPTLPSLHLRHSSFNPSVASPTLQFILQPILRFSYVTGSSPGEPPWSPNLMR